MFGIFHSNCLNWFTPAAMKIVVMAAGEAMALKQKKVEPEHLFISALAIGNGAICQVLKAAGVDAEKARQLVKSESTGETRFEADVPKPYGVSGKSISRLTKRSLMGAVALARLLKHGCVGTDHLVLALLRERKGELPGLIDRLKIDRGKCEKAFLEFCEQPN